MLYTEQKLIIEEAEVLTIKYINNIIQNINLMSKNQIKNKLLNLYDIFSRY